MNWIIRSVFLLVFLSYWSDVVTASHEQPELKRFSQHSCRLDHANPQGGVDLQKSQQPFSPSCVDKNYKESLLRVLNLHTTPYSNPMIIALNFAAQMGNVEELQVILNNPELSIPDLRRAYLFSIGDYRYVLGDKYKTDKSDVQAVRSGVVGAMIMHCLWGKQKMGYHSH